MAAAAAVPHCCPVACPHIKAENSREVLGVRLSTSKGSQHTSKPFPPHSLPLVQAQHTGLRITLFRPRARVIESRACPALLAPILALCLSYFTRGRISTTNLWRHTFMTRKVEKGAELNHARRDRRTRDRTQTRVCRNEPESYEQRMAAMNGPFIHSSASDSCSPK